MDVEIEQALHRIYRVVTVKGRQHHVASLGCTNSFKRGFMVANLADQNDVRVLAYERAHGVSEIEADVRAYPGLLNAVDGVLDRILNRDYLARRILSQQLQAGIEGRGLARTGRADYQHQAGRVTQQAAIRVGDMLLHPQFLDADQRGVLWQQTDYNVLAMQRRLNLNAQIEARVAHPRLGTPALRQSPLGDVQLGAQFDHVDQPGILGRRDVVVIKIAQLAIDTQPHTNIGTISLQMDITGPVCNGVQQ